MTRNKENFVADLFGDFPEGNMPMYDIGNRRYMGSKTKLVGWIHSVIYNVAHDACTFFDVFAGTGAVGNKALDYYEKVVFNDFLYSNFVTLNAFLADGNYDKERVKDFIDEMNNVDGSLLPENYFSINFGGKYFGMEAARKIGYIREEIEARMPEFSMKEYYVLVASLIYSADRIANTIGQYEAYRKNVTEFKDFEMGMVEAKCHDCVRIYNKDANVLAREVKCDIAYLDPPYNSRQYCSLYHVPENLAKWDKPEVHYDTAKPLDMENKSEYCRKNALKVFTDLVLTLDARYIAVSYNNTYNAKSDTSNNKMTLEDIRQTLEMRGITMVFEKDYKPFDAGKTELDNHKEYLFLTKVK